MILELRNTNLCSSSLLSAPGMVKLSSWPWQRRITCPPVKNPKDSTRRRQTLCYKSIKVFLFLLMPWNHIKNYSIQKYLVAILCKYHHASFIFHFSSLLADLNWPILWKLFLKCIQVKKKKVGCLFWSLVFWFLRSWTCLQPCCLKSR